MDLAYNMSATFRKAIQDIRRDVHRIRFATKTVRTTVGHTKKSFNVTYGTDGNYISEHNCK